MFLCVSCGKKPNKIDFSRHKKGSSGHGGEWNLKAPISKHIQRPNLHTFKNKKYCTKCLRIVKPKWTAPKETVAPSAQA